MNKALKWTLILIPVLAGGYVIYTQIKKYNGAKAPGTGTPPAGNGTVNGGGGGTPGCIFPLKKGSTGSCVQQLQRALIAYYGPSILPKYGADGNWGSETDGAMKALTGTAAASISSQADLDSTIQYLNP